MIVLGISDSHEAHACVVRDGELLAAIAEERLSRLKTDTGYPRQAIDMVLKMSGIRPHQIDVVALAGDPHSPLYSLVKQHALFSVQDWITQCYEYWKPVLIDGKHIDQIEEFSRWRHLRGADIEHDPYYPFIERHEAVSPVEYRALFRKIRIEAVTTHLGIPAEKVRIYRHEDCHKYYGFYSQAQRRERTLLFTLEGGGDDSSATVSTVDKGRIAEHFSTNNAMMGRLYRYITLLLAMKPCQHEYKVMGLAPFGNEYHGRKALEFFRQMDRVEGTAIVNSKLFKDVYFSSRAALEGVRFDGIAWALQEHLEEIVTQWVVANARAHGIADVVFSGGVAQNIKAIKALADLSELSSVWAGPISGDGSLGIGAAWLAAAEIAPNIPIAGLETVYLGTEYDGARIHKTIEMEARPAGFHIIEKPSPEHVADWLCAGLVAARFSGRMEFGQRALGNRSILADPRRAASVERINAKIKYRDFWMPFTPSMTHAEAERLLKNPKGIYSPFMTMAFDLRSGVAEQLPAVIHPADKTARAQMLKVDDNPGYHALLEAVKVRTGFGVVLNTSLNLHGEAIVETPEQAIDTFKRSDLDLLVFDDIAISRHDLKTV